MYARDIVLFDIRRINRNIRQCKEIKIDLMQRMSYALTVLADYPLADNLFNDICHIVIILDQQQKQLKKAQEFLANLMA